MNASLSGSKVSIIIPARDESRTIAKVIKQAKLVSPDYEIIVVCNGSKDRTPKMAKRAGATKVVISNTFLGYDVGRSVGAEYASGDILLFLDADTVIPSELLKHYVSKVEEGWDLVLNEYSGSQKHRASMAKHLLNYMVGRPDLTGSSMSTVPHALSRHALKVIGIQELSVPPVAHATAIVKGLSVTTCGYINTSKGNRKRPGRRKLMLGDHAEAISYLVSCYGVRGGMTDYGRCREALTSPMPFISEEVVSRGDQEEFSSP